ncbi:hypothetical protein HPLT_01105 [Helicobacter pylori Lithuania75]|uniref:hypothetical protein n=1 Tax=Helicobacter pylori TaxID=210 RepID=UPI0001F6D128|nr:hypothetical protein [Helicobacter pylori]ADU82663.1 hypothetical protein HPLT_01105 [Helicobacter pylori Lithuania75]
MNGEWFWRKGFIFNTNAFFAGKNHQTNSSFTCQYPFIIAYKSGVMLDKVTKACYNFLALFCFCSFYAPVVEIKILKGFYQATLKRVAVQSIF